MTGKENETPLQAVLFDFGGVIAEEGFRLGLKTLARENGFDPESFYNLAVDSIFASGYVTGHGTEADFWQRIRRAGLQGADEVLRARILEGFRVRPQMVDVARAMRRQGVLAAILSDQTDWLDSLDARDHFFQYFDRVFNSYHLGKSKQDPTLFDDVLRVLGVSPGRALFVDDHPGNIERARSRGLRVILYRDYESFADELQQVLGGCPITEIVAREVEDGPRYSRN